MKLCLILAAVVLSAVGWPCPAASEAGVVVLSNRTTAKVEFTIVQAGGSSQETIRHSLAPRDLVPIPVTREVGIAFGDGKAARRLLLSANTIYYFLTRNEKLDLVRLALPTASEEADPPAPAEPGARIASVYTIAVMLLTDDDEPAVRRIWEARLRKRLAKASEIFEQHCRVRFKVVAVDTWESDDSIHDFHESLREFEQTVDPAPARLAVGFTSQYEIPKGRTQLGGTRGPLHSHILIREWSQHISSTERLEVLAHELGHFLGAAHSAEDDSIMRPTLGDRRARAREFRIGFDPVNTLIMYLVGEELRGGKFQGLGRLHAHRKARLRSAYLALSEVMPDDPTTKKYVVLLDSSSSAPPKPVRHPKPLVEATQVVVSAITEAARRNHRLPVAGSPSRLAGDRLTEYYVRRAAAAAAELPSDVAAKAFLLGLGVALDHSTMLRNAPILGSLCRQAESDRQRGQRLAVLGSPTVQGRRDLAQHFFVSAALTALVGPQNAESAGILKELKDSRGSSGFSFADLSADIAGVTFATHVLDSKIPLATLATSFAVKDFQPGIDHLKEGIAWKDFVEAYGLGEDARFQRERSGIRNQIRALPGYQNR